MQFYTTGNYHWYCKLSYDFAMGKAPTAISWDPDHTSAFHVAFEDARFNSYVFNFMVDRQAVTGRHALVAVIDGSKAGKFDR